MDIHSVLIGTIKNKSISVLVSFSIEPKKSNKIVEIKALIDSGAGGKFIDQNFVRNLKLKKKPLKKPIKVFNVDGTLNKKGTITHKVQLYLRIGDKFRKETLLVTGLGKQKIILGFPWLQSANPNIDWQSGRITWKETTKIH